MFKFTYSFIREQIERHLQLDENNEYALDLILATALSIDTDRPVWLMLTAPASSGKTELMKLISKVKNHHILSNLTSKTLFSGHSSAKGGYMMREVKAKGVLAFPDFTTVLSLNSKAKNEVFNQLRVIYDGVAGLETGLVNDKKIMWKGKVALLASVTGAIEEIKERSTDLGERFLYYNFTPSPMDVRALSMKRDTKALTLLYTNVKQFLQERIHSLTDFEISDNELFDLDKLANFISLGRAVVTRDGKSREITHVLSPEMPYRTFIALKSLYASLVCINGESKRSLNILREVAKSSIPLYRYKVLYLIDSCKDVFDVLAAEERLGIARTKIRRLLEDLYRQKMVENSKVAGMNKKDYEIHPDFEENWKFVNTVS